jgi:hypothetical protein
MAFLEEGGAAYVPPDLLTDSSDYNIDKNYFDVVVTDLKVNTDYNFQFAWVKEDKTVSEYSANYTVKTSSIVIPEVTDIITQWAASTLSIFFKRPEETIAGVVVNRAKSFIITLTALNGSGVSKTATFTPNVDTLQTQQKFELTEARMDTWRKSDGTKYIPSAFSGKIQVVNNDGTSIGVEFVSAANSDGITGSSIADNEWSLTSVLDGYFVNIVAFTTAAKAEFYSYTEVWESITTGGPYSLVARGVNPIARVYVSDLTNKYVKIRHAAKAGTFSNYSNEKTIASANPSGFDATGPNNNNPITPGTPVIDGDGLFDFNYKVPFSWTEETDTTVQGYRIRWRINGTSTGYMTTVVPGRLTTTTMLFGVLAGQTYEVGKNTYDEYGNTTAAWQTITVSIPAFTGTMASGKFLSAGNMKLGYGIGGNAGPADTNTAVNKGLYLGPSNYWYITGNTVTDSGAYLKVGSSSSNMTFDGTDLSVTGTINALAGNFTGSISVGSPTVPGQLRVIKSYAVDGVTPTAAVEIGKFNSAVTVGGVTSTHGIYAYDTTGKYVLINASDASIRANNIIASGSFTTYGPITTAGGGTANATSILSAGKLSIATDQATGLFSWTTQSLLSVESTDSKVNISPSGIAVNHTGLSTGFDLNYAPATGYVSFNIFNNGGAPIFRWLQYQTTQRAANANRDAVATRPLVVTDLGLQYLGAQDYYGANSSTSMANFSGNGYDGDFYFSTNTA